MTTSVGGTAGITYPDGTNISSANVSALYTPYMTNTANVTSIVGDTIIDGTIGVYAPSLGYMATNKKQLSYVFSANTQQASINLSKLPGYKSGFTNLNITVNSGIYVWSDSTSTPALSITGQAAGDTVTIVNNGYIIGRGGDGGSDGGNGKNGGPALSIGGTTIIDNTNSSAYIAGGGGGGAGGNWNGGMGGGGGAGGGNGGSGNGNAGGSGGAIGATGGNGGGGNAGHGGGSGGGGGDYQSGGGGGGRILPGTGGISGNISVGNNGGSANTAGGAGGTYEGSGGGGWGASGGTGGTGVGSTPGAGGKAVQLNGYSVTWVGGNTTRVYGTVS